MRKPKYQKGHKIESMGQLNIVLKSGQYVYLRDRPIHPGFIMGMPYRTLMYAIDSGALYLAIPNEETNGD